MQLVTSKKMKLKNQDFHKKIIHNHHDIRISKSNFNTFLHPNQIIPYTRKWINLLYRIQNSNLTTNLINKKVSRMVNYRLINRLNLNLTFNLNKLSTSLKKGYKSIMNIEEHNTILTDMFTDERNITKNFSKSLFSRGYNNIILSISDIKQENNFKNHLSPILNHERLLQNERPQNKLYDFNTVYSTSNTKTNESHLYTSKFGILEFHSDDPVIDPVTSAQPEIIRDKQIVNETNSDPIKELQKTPDIDLNRLADQVYSVIERKIQIEKERRGLFG